LKNSFSRKDNHRKSLIRNLVTSFILYEEIKTTKPKSKEVKSTFEHLMNIAKKNDLNSKRRILSFVFDKKAALKMFEVLVPRFKKVQSGFIKIYKLGPRKGDASEQVILKLSGGEENIVEKESQDKKEINAQGKIKQSEKKLEKKLEEKTVQ